MTDAGEKVALSEEWTGDAVTYRMDGVVVATLSRHRPETDTVWLASDNAYEAEFCVTCGHPWPCATERRKRK